MSSSGLTGRLRRIVGPNASERFVLGAIALAVFVLTLIPLVFLLWTSVWSGFPGDFSGSFTVENFVAVYVNGSFDALELFGNSLFVAAGTTVVSITFGLLFAWLLVRTNLPTKGAMELVLLAPYAIPVYIYAFMYIVTYGSQQGLVLVSLQRFLGLESVPIDVFSRWGIAFVVGINMVNTVYLLTAPALQNMDPALEEVGRIHGASLPTTLRTISFPLVIPAILSAVLVTFLRGLGEFSVVAILGAPEGFDVYATAIWEAVRLRAPPQYGEAAALAFSLLIVTAAFVWYYRRITGRKQDYMTVRGRGYRARRWDLGGWRWPLAGGLWVLLFFVWLLPVLVMVLVSFHSLWTGQPDVTVLSTEHYVTALTDVRLRGAFFNSVFVAVASATIGTVLVVGMAYYTERTEYRFRGVVDFLSLTPMAIPGIIMGGSLLFTFLWVGRIHPLVDLYGTLWIMVIGSIIVYIPISSRIAVGNIVQIHTELEEAARIVGASWGRSVREVFVPLFKTPMAIIWFYLAIQVFHLLTIPIMTYSTGTEVIPVEVFTLYTRGAELELVSAISTLFVAVTVVVLLALRWFGVTIYDMNARSN
ncbi:ABC transporter permease [Halorubrum sp. DTA98]|uniref:ABC transporter permease n=1 Tax=Halorubrum sp. DTA98 TaxID=3402163 RepID=UPI003AAB56CC